MYTSQSSVEPMITRNPSSAGSSEEGEPSSPDSSEDSDVSSDSKPPAARYEPILFV
eukprot:CAMPEP_0170961686 /NCGR_PEP_ID=MMETSP0735-20130129/38239_1 /TAXON_ID=186038 /ORGANISM="Fragilariopsis kerguelensis, Strain L26-C5" /LENGTH=55 /DNA_ID=CAMNT_0011377429 /DNA_START=14 /DNA_END=181 /DNA_ORIENTATION=-